YDELKSILKQELHAAPSAATRELARAIAGLGSEEDDSGQGSALDARCPQSARREAQSAELSAPRAPGASRFAPGAPLPTAGTHEVGVCQGPPPAVAGTRGRPPTGLEPVGGAVPLGSPFYVVRSADVEFQQAVERGDSIVLVKGARQVGKTSLLARQLQQAREAGARVVFTDFQLLSEAHLCSAEALVPILG